MVKITWVDGQREPTCPPDPRCPKGIDIDMSRGAVRSCQHALPYPAKRCGHYLIVCETCKQRAIVTTAGRVDDPRSIRLACLT